MATRHERVVLTLEDNFTSQMAQAAAATALMNQQLGGPNGLSNSQNNAATSTNGLNQQVGALGQQSQQTSTHLGGLGNQTQGLGQQFDRASGRVSLLIDGLIGLGPAAIPVGAVAVPAISGLASMLGVAVAAAGTLVVAFQGVGDALESVNAARLDPTIENLEKMHEAVGKIGPEAQGFVTAVSSMRGQLTDLQRAAAAGFFPPLTAELGDLGPLLERTESLLSDIGRAAGVGVANGLDSLNSDRWEDFFEFLGREAGPTMRDLAKTVGNVAHGLSEMWMAFQPLNRDFGDWLVEQTEDFDEWAQRLEGNEAFEDFVDYIRNSGPQVAETFGAIGGAIVDIVQAAAPLGGPVLQVIEAIADVVSTIADSDFGGPLIAGLAAMTLFNRGAQATRTLMAGSFMTAVRQTSGGLRTLRADFRNTYAAGAPIGPMMANTATSAARFRTTMRGLAGGAAIIGGLGIAASGAADGMGLTNTISLGLMGTLAGPWGAAVGAGVGLMMDMGAASDKAAEAQRRLRQASDELVNTFDPMTGLLTDQTRAMIEQRLVAEGADQIAQQLGLSNKELVDVITGASPNFTELTSNLRDQGNQGEFLATVVTGLAGEYREASNESISLAEATGRGVDEYRNATDAINELAAAYEAWNDTLSAFDAETAFEASFDALNAALVENGATLDANTEAGRNVREALSGASQATMDWVDTLPSSERSAGIQLARDRVYDMALEMGLSSEAAAAWADEVALSADTVSAAASGAAAQTLYLRDMFNSLPSNVQTDIRTNGFPQTEAEVDALIAKYPSLEGKRETLIALQAQAATAGVRSYLDYVRQVQGTRVTTIITRYKTEGRPAPGTGMQIAQAHGGIISTITPAKTVIAYARGGLDVANRHMPEMTTAGSPMRIWAEPETGGESYIPHAKDRRQRAKSITEQTAALFGGEVRWFDQGGIVAAERRFMRAQQPAPRVVVQQQAASAGSMVQQMAAPEIDYNRLAAAMSRANFTLSADERTAAKFRDFQDLSKRHLD